MSEEITIRRAGKGDARTVAGFNVAMARETEARVLPQETALAGVLGLLSHPEYGFYLLAEAEGVVLGCLMVTFEWSDWRNGLFWWVQSVYVHPEHRRRGVYRRLYGYLREAALGQAGVCGLRLYVERDNAAACRTYEALGMKEAHYRMFEEELARA
jgi:GNAT superfamily N-acetyltransferase